MGQKDHLEVGSLCNVTPVCGSTMPSESDAKVRGVENALSPNQHVSCRHVGVDCWHPGWGFIGIPSHIHVCRIFPFNQLIL